MTMIDKSKPVWRVVGRLPQPDGRRMTVFCNATTAQEAGVVGRAEGMDTVEYAVFITPEQIERWEAMVPKTPEGT